MGPLLNVALRLHILYFLWEVLRQPHDPRFERKALPIRNLVVVLLGSMVFPAAHVLRRRRSDYPFGLDNLYLSIFWLDMAGNSFDLYERYRDFDVIPHTHGTGALGVVLQGAGLSASSAIGWATVLHVLLEMQEYYTDVFFETRNVHGARDVIKDLTAGIAGVLLYVPLYALLRRRRVAERAVR